MNAHAQNALCPRLFEVEALRDGRLGGSERARFEAHLGTCAICARELQALEELATALRADDGLGNSDELHARRERVRLIAAFNAKLVPPGRKASITARLVPAASLVALAMLAIVFMRWRSDHATHRAAAAPSNTGDVTAEAVDVHADAATQWSRLVDSRGEILTLESGTLTVHVDHTASSPKLIVVLPDGELEDMGTTFSVTVAQGHTTHIDVRDGRVLARFQGQPALPIAAGESWSAPSMLVAPLAASSPSLAPPSPASSLPSSSPARSSSRDSSAPSARFARSAEPSAPSSSPTTGGRELATDSAVEFRVAMAALNARENARAAALFGSFVAQHPSDARAEDAAYLRVIALQRAGNSSSMKQAANAYLDRYPTGFRRAEIEPLSR